MVFLLIRPTWCSSIFLLFAFFAVLILLCGAENGEYSIQCSRNFTCGNINVSYPFWGNGRQKYCGHEGFELKCQEEKDGYQEYPFIELENKRYLVLKIDQSSYIMTIARSDLWVNSCLEVANVSFATTINHAFFDYAPGVSNLTIIYGCIDPHLLEPRNIVFPCTNNDVGYNETVAFFVNESVSQKEKELQSYINRCSVSIQVPIHQWALENLTSQKISLLQALKEGFDLKYDDVDRVCPPCRSSGGICGTNIISTAFACYCQAKPYPYQCPHRDVSGSRNVLRITLIGVGSVIGGFVLTIILFFLIKSQKLFSNRFLGHQDIEDLFGQYGSLTIKRYNYSEVKRMTNSFKIKLGQGGYGAVYKGMLQNGCTVAVKILNTSKGNGEEFINEVASISKTSHVNVVTLLGFCFEGKRRALIFEFMVNGSLDKFIHDGTTTLPHAQLGWEKLYQIAIGIARGLEYLHRGCNTRILHFDIKPHNILLDKEFHPKISDFGLAKLCPNKESIVSMMIARGTVGYIAPEVFNRNFGGVSHKSDVYSYGMMVLEMAGVKKKINVEVDNSSELYFPDYIYKRLELGHGLELHGNLTSEESKILWKMTLIGLWCIQIKSFERPSMSKVIEMFEGNVEDLQIPPKPFFASPPRVTKDSYSTSAFLTEE